MVGEDALFWFSESLWAETILAKSHWAKTKKNNEMISRLNLSCTNLSFLFMKTNNSDPIKVSKSGSHLEV